MVTHLLVHGFAGTPVGWAQVIPRLRGNVVAPALPGHNSDALPSFAAYVAWVRAQAESLPRPLHVVGYSAGARLVAGALADGLACDAASLISVNLGLASAAEREARLVADAVWSAMLRNDGIEAFLDAWEQQPVFASQRLLPADVRMHLRLERSSLNADALADAMDALSLGRMPDLHAAMRAQTVPWQLIVGALDPKFVALSRLVGAPRVTELPACGHNPLLEAPKALATVLDEFVQALGSPPSH